MERKHWHQALPRACGSPSWEDISPSALAASLVAVSGMLMPQRPSITTLGSLSQDFHPWITAREDTTEPGRDFSGQQHQPSCSREFTSGKRGKLVSGMVWVQTGPAQSWGPPALGRFSTPASPSPGGIRGSEVGQRGGIGAKQGSRSILGEG